MKTIWKATVCIVVVLLSFSIYSCGDDDDDAVGSRDLLLGTWNGVYYLSQEIGRASCRERVCKQV